jgi:GNAT superfamily N-acetyltransferase
MKIRAPTLTDLNFIVEAQIKMALETENIHLDRDVVLAGCKAVFNDPAKGRYWIVEDSGRVKGMCLTIPEWSDWRNGTVLWIHSVYTLPDARGQGVYKVLYNHLKELVQNSSELRGLRLYVDKRNVNAQKVYQKCGMSAEHYEMYEWLKG